MRFGYLTFHDVDALARQAVDLLTPQAHLTIEETPRSNAYVYPQATGGDHGLWRVTATIAPGNSAVLSVDPSSAPAAALGSLIVQLAAACDHNFRGRAFPECPGHSHPANIRVDREVVVLACSTGDNESMTLVPDVAAG